MQQDLLTLRDNRAVLLRSLTLDDVPLLERHFLALSELSRFRRFLGVRKRLPVRELQAYTDVDHRDREAIGALAIDRGNLVGVGQYWRDETDRTVADVGLSVTDDFQGAGLGTALLIHLARRARAAGISRFRAQVHESNRRCLHLGRHIGSRVGMAFRAPGVIEAEFDLNGVDPLPATSCPSTEEKPPIGFIGLGRMGQPMALNLAAAGTPLIVWNRTPSRSEPLAAAGASVAATAADVFAKAGIVIMMLAGDAAIDTVLDRQGPAFSARVREHTIIHVGTTSPAYSQTLERDIRDAGGSYVEAPVSGSRVPAENGQLVALLAGERNAVDAVQPILAPMCRAMIDCGSVPNGLLMKLAVNVFLITQVTGLAESFHFAARNGLDLTILAAALNGGQMASDISRVKVARLLEGNFDAQAAIADVLKNNALIVDAARRASAASPLIDVCHALFGEALDRGLGGADMIAVLRAIEARDHGANCQEQSVRLRHED